MKQFEVQFSHYIKQDKIEGTEIINGRSEQDAKRNFIAYRSYKYDFLYIISVKEKVKF